MKNQQILPLKRKNWTKDGLIALGLLIRRSRENAGLSLREAAELIHERTGELLSFRTIGAVENSTGIPQFNTLEAIAASGLVKGDDGSPLTIYHFIDVASECHTMTFKELLQYELDRRGWTVRELADDAEIDYEDLAEIFAGNPPQEYLIYGLATQLTNPQTGERFIYPHEVIEFCNIKEIAPNREDCGEIREDCATNGDGQM